VCKQYPLDAEVAEVEVAMVERHATIACSSGGVDVRASTIGGATQKGQQQPQGLHASFRIRSSRSSARKAGGSARVCVGQDGHARGRVKGATMDLAGKATTATDSATKTAIRPKGRRIQPGVISWPL
jgi:hypothetical protein